MGTLLHNCAQVRELIELSCGIVSGVSQGMGVLDRIYIYICLDGVFNRNVLDSCVKS